MQVRNADNGAELLEHEEAGAVVNHAAPIERTHQMALFGCETGLLEERLLIGPESCAPGRVDEGVKEPV